MLTERALEFLCPLKYRQDAERRVSWIPLGGIYWTDEIPDPLAFQELPEADRSLILRLFCIRFRIWNGEELSADDHTFWESARQQVPDSPVFQRLTLSPDDRRAQQEFERQAFEAFQVLKDHAENFELTERANGSAGFSLTFDLTTEQPELKRWWQRFTRS